MSKIIFEERVVAFIDVLGFSSLVIKASQDNDQLVKLQSLVDLLKSTIPFLDNQIEQTVPLELIPKHNYISDCIILSAPLQVSLPSWSHYNGLEIIAMRIIQLTHRFLEGGFLLRGGIEVGKVWHGDTNILGPAYQKAYHLETCTNRPRIVLTNNAQQFWEDKPSRLCISYKGSFMVNGLHDYYIPVEGTNRIEKAFDRYNEIVNNNIRDTLPENALSKWRWFKQYLRDEQVHALQWNCPQV